MLLNERDAGHRNDVVNWGAPGCDASFNLERSIVRSEGLRRDANTSTPEFKALKRFVPARYEHCVPNRSVPCLMHKTRRNTTLRLRRAVHEKVSLPM